MVCKRTQIRRVVNEFVRRLRKQANLPVDKIFLFGSYAWGKPTHRSDIDLAVISKKFRRINNIKRIKILSDVVRHVHPELKVDIDVVGFTEDEFDNSNYFDLASEIKEKGLLVYKKAA